MASQLLLREAEEHLASALRDFNAMRLYFQDRTDIPATEIARVTQNFGRAAQTLFDERKKVEKLKQLELGIVQGYATDFNAIRGEIGGVLDRLRIHGGSVEVP